VPQTPHAVAQARALEHQLRWPLALLAEAVLLLVVLVLLQLQRAQSPLFLSSTLRGDVV
jgi:hypothetical protein